MPSGNNLNSLYSFNNNVSVSSNNFTTLYSPGVSGNVTTGVVADRNFTTLYTKQSDIQPTKPYGNSNVEAFLNVGSDFGGNQVQNIVMSGNINVGGQSNLGPVGNVHIDGGQLNYILTTDGGGGLTWAVPPNNVGSIIPYIHFVAPTTGFNQQFTDSGLSAYGSNVQFVNLMKNGVNIEPTDFQFINATTIQVNILLVAGDNVDVLATGSGGATPGGNVYEVQYNGGLGDFIGNASFTFFQATSTLTVGNIITGNIDSNNIVTGNITVSAVSNLGSVGNVIITGGSANQVLSTDGAGNLSWVVQSGTSANANIMVQDEGSNIVSSNTMNFVGSGVTVSNIGNVATITIPGGGTSIVTWNDVVDKNGSNGPTTISIGQNSVGNVNSIALGISTGAINQQPYAVAIGTEAGNSNQGEGSISIGYIAGTTSQGNGAVAIGRTAGYGGQGSNAVAVGYTAGTTNQGNGAVAVGFGAGGLNQKFDAVSIGTSAGAFNQGNDGIAIGYNAGYQDQGNFSIAIGYFAGANTQHTRSIVMNATTLGVDSPATDSFTVKPVRNANTSNVMFYNTTSGEITYDLLNNVANANYANYAGNAFSVSGSNVSGTVANANYAAYAGNITIANQPNITTTGTLTDLTIAGNLIIQRGYEKFTTVGTGATGTINYDALTQSILYYSANATANCTVNIRGNSSTTLDSILPTNDTLTVVFLNTVGSTAYIANTIQIDGNTVTPKFVNGSSPNIGIRLANAQQSYTFTIMKTAGNTYNVLGSLTEYQ